MYKHLSNQIIRTIIVLAIIVIGYFVFTYTIPYTFPFIIALLLSLVINPFVTLLEKRVRIPRTLATFIAIIILLFGVIGIMFLIISEIIQGTLYLADRIPTYFQTFISVIESFVYEKVLPFYDAITSYFNTLHPAQQETVQENIQQVLDYITTTGTTFLQNFFLNIPSMVLILPNSLTIILFVILAMFFITKDWDKLKLNLSRVLPEKVQTYYGNFIVHLKQAFGGYLKAQATLISISTCIIFIGLLILQVEHALTITLFAAIFDIMPFIGTGIIFIPWIIFSFVTADYAMTISLSVLFGIIIIVRQVLEPKILSESIGVNPLFGLIALFICMQIFGVIGILIAPAMMILVYVFIESGTFKKIWLFIKG